jgi:hypothetical protein
MSTNANRYLEKIAGRFDKVISFADDLIGHSHGAFKAEAETLSRAQALGRTAKDALHDTAQAKDRMVKARVKTGLGVAGVGTAGFLGLHKYHQHKDNAIMAKIDSMYVDPNS